MKVSYNIHPERIALVLKKKQIGSFSCSKIGKGLDHHPNRDIEFVAVVIGGSVGSLDFRFVSTPLLKDKMNKPL